ncbi:GspE/PulE family protein [Kiloniella spongiae]|uniref:GspE/PulE family protein n=1 Tax=Kiloniella spongiae TaxID=1489064 RepID=UPI001951A786|nr:ATPase, T2SS/T4P/T4SS family [Kiloniella spongiae]
MSALPFSDIAAFETALGDQLVAAGKLDLASLQRAKTVQGETRECLNTLVSKLGLVAERDLAEVLAHLLDCPLVGKEDFPAEALYSERFNASFLKGAGALILGEDADSIFVALCDPTQDFVINALQLATGKVTKVSIAVPAELEAAIDRLFVAAADPDLEGSVISTSLDELDTDVERLKDLASGAPVIRLVNQLINRAVESKASDIHIEPFENILRVRFRLDGYLQEVMTPSLSLHAALMSRLKIMANLDIAERRLPQDGRIKLAVRGTQIDLRLSIVPTMHGETAVLRVLDRSTVQLDFDDLGITGVQREQLDSLLERPHGIFLVTGPTGSGKTTTLYACLSILNQPDSKILTVEDPVEYQLQGINQIQTQASINLTFPRVLRSLLRQDPDILMIGEIRDQETAEIAVQSALTGHLVLSTLHTNDAVGSVTRLLDMGIDDYLVSSTLNGVMAQRLVRRLCPACKVQEPVLPEMAEQLGFGEILGTLPDQLYRPVGCGECNQTGYRGRRALVEVLTLSEEFSRLLLSRANNAELKREALKEGMVPLYHDGLAKVLAGETTIEEVLRVARR